MDGLLSTVDYWYGMVPSCRMLVTLNKGATARIKIFIKASYQSGKGGFH